MIQPEHPDDPSKLAVMVPSDAYPALKVQLHGFFNTYNGKEPKPQCVKRNSVVVSFLKYLSKKHGTDACHKINVVTVPSRSHPTGRLPITTSRSVPPLWL